jgi:UDP-glucose 4-epimerase
MRWLITGGCGFIGGNLISRLLSRPELSVRIVDNLSSGGTQRLAMVTRFDTIDPALALRVVEGVDAIIHLAAATGVGPSVDDPRFDCTTNVIGTLNYLEAARRCGVKRFVFASSGAPIGECSPPIHEEMVPHPVSPYGASKLAGEGYCSAYSRSYGMDAVALRFGNCYGPLSGHKESVVAKFIREALLGSPWEIYGDGRQTRDFIFVEDIAAAIELAGTVSGIGGEIFQIATNSETTVLELAQRLAAILKARGITPPTIRHQASRTGDVRRNFSDITKAIARLGWRASVPLEQGLNRTVDWFLAERAAGRLV